MDKILILPTRSNPNGKLYSLSKQESEKIHQKLIAFKFDSEFATNIIKFQEDTFDEYFNKDPNKYKEFLIELAKITPNKGDKLFVYAIKNKDYQLLKNLAIENIVYMCFLKDFISQFKNCATIESNKETCIQNVINNMLSQILSEKNVNYDCITLLIELGADVNTQGSLKDTALSRASFRDKKDIVELLLKKGANVNIQNEMGHTALIEASRIGNIEIVKLLLQYDANPNIKDKFGNTALIEATMNNYLDIVELLLKKGADPDIKNMNGKTAIKIAYSKKDILNELKKYSKENKPIRI